MIKGFRDLLVWQKAMDLAAECHRTTAEFPRSEQYGLTLQLRKSAGSVPANIAEGRGRRTTAEFTRFLDIAYGSLTELQTHLLLANRLGFCEDQSTELLVARADEVGRMINGLIVSLRKREKLKGRAARRPIPLNPES